MIATAEPLGLGEVIVVETDRPVNVERIADLVRTSGRAWVPLGLGEAITAAT